MRYQNILLIVGLLCVSTANARNKPAARSAEQLQKSVRGCEGWGFYAEFLWVANHLQYCQSTGLIPVVYWGDKFAYYHPEGYNGSVNAWEYYFEPVSEQNYNPGDRFEKRHWYNKYFSTLWNYDQYLANLVLCSNEEKKDFIKVTNGKFPKGENYPNSGKHLYNKEFRQSVKRDLIDPYIKIKPSITQKIDAFYAHTMADKITIGIHLRGKHIANEVLFVPIERILEEANKFAGEGVQFFVATDQSNLIDLAKKLLNGPVIYYESQRFAATTSPTPGQKLHPILGENIVIEMVLLASCQHLVHTISNVSTAALYFNPALEHTVLY